MSDNGDRAVRCRCGRVIAVELLMGYEIRNKGRVVRAPKAEVTCECQYTTVLDKTPRAVLAS